MQRIIIVVLAFVLDAVFGDPAWLPHPVILMGRCISGLEKRLRAAFPESPEGERRAGRVLVFLMTGGTLAVSLACVCLLSRIHPLAGTALQVFWGAQCLAARGLYTEGENVLRTLRQGTLPEARSAVGRIVGRDTAELTEAGVIRACVESVAENFSDGVFAPMLYLALFGAPGALVYKAVNTMDSMVGYKNERYLHFGRAAARLDDAANWLPARLSALLLALSAFVLQRDGRGALRIWRRDRRKHESPNSAQTESAMAGALGIALGGPASYFGIPHEKPWLGDALREPVPEDIGAADRLMAAASLLGLAFLVLCMCSLRGGLL